MWAMMMSGFDLVDFEGGGGAPVAAELAGEVEVHDVEELAVMADFVVEVGVVDGGGDEGVGGVVAFVLAGGNVGEELLGGIGLGGGEVWTRRGLEAGRAR